MKNKIASFFFLSFLILFLFAATSCGDRRKDDEGKTSEEINHEEENPTVVSLTKEQINVVGIQTARLENKNLTAKIKAYGNLSVPNNHKANVTSLFGGVIKNLTVQPGDYVKKGQLIAVIQNPRFIQIQQDLLDVKNRILLAGQELNRQKELNEGNAGALKNLQTATSELNSLETRKSALEQQIRLMGINPNTITNQNLRNEISVLSPISGNISHIFAKIGSYVDVASPLAEIVDNSLLHLDLQIFEKDLPFVKTGQEIDFELTNNPNRNYTAKVFSIGSSFENESKTIAVHSRVSGEKTGLIDGMNVTANISINDIFLPAVSDSSIVEENGKYYVFVKKNLEEENHRDEIRFEKIEVIKGTSDLGYTAVMFIEEIPEDAEIVTQGAFFINAKLTNTEGHHHE